MWLLSPVVEPDVRRSLVRLTCAGYSRIVTRPTSDRTFTVISLFSGAMGLDIGLEQTGRFQTLAAVEEVPSFCETIRKNAEADRIGNGSMRVYEGDIRCLDPLDVLSDLGLKPGEVDLVVGGPPCQAFSTNGRRGSVEDPRGTLLWEFLRFIDAIRPSFFLMENVRGLMSAALQHRPTAERPEKGGPPLNDREQPGSVVQEFIRDLSGGYRMDVFEVNAVNYGAPQLRERVFFIGNRVDCVVDFPDPTHGLVAVGSTQDELFADEKVTLLPYKNLGEALRGLSEKDPVRLEFSPRKQHFLDMVPPGGNWRSLPPEVAEESMGKSYFIKGGRSGWWRRLSLDLPSPTIVTMPNHASTALCHPTETRALTLRECARVQEFPDDWEFCGRPTEQFAQVGNAVPVRLGEVAGQVLIEHLEAKHSCEPAALSKVPTVRQVNVQSHVRTRKWFDKGKAVVRGASGTASD